MACPQRRSNVIELGHRERDEWLRSEPNLQAARATSHVKLSVTFASCCCHRRQLMCQYCQRRFAHHAEEAIRHHCVLAMPQMPIGEPIRNSHHRGENSTCIITGSLTPKVSPTERLTGRATSGRLQQVPRPVEPPALATIASSNATGICCGIGSGSKVSRSDTSVATPARSTFKSANGVAMRSPSCSSPHRLRHLRPHVTGCPKTLERAIV